MPSSSKDLSHGSAFLRTSRSSCMIPTLQRLNPSHAVSPQKSRETSSWKTQSRRSGANSTATTTDHLIRRRLKPFWRRPWRISHLLTNTMMLNSTWPSEAWTRTRMASLRKLRWQPSLNKFSRGRKRPSSERLGYAIERAQVQFRPRRIVRPELG